MNNPKDDLLSPLERFERFGQAIFAVKKEDFLKAEAEAKVEKEKLVTRKTPKRKGKPKPSR